MQFVFRAAIIALLVLPCLGITAKPIDLTGRHLPFMISDDSILSGTLESRFVPGGKSVQVKPELTPDAASLIYGLLIPGIAETTVTVNGARVDIVPLERRDSLLYWVDANQLTVGENAVRIDRSTAASWAGVVMFSLIDTFEEDHFNQAFSKVSATSEARSVRDTPPSSNQDDYDVLWYDCTWAPSMSAAYMNVGSEATMGARALVNNFQTADIDFDMNPSGNGGAPMVIDYIDSGAGTAPLSYVIMPSSVAPRIRVTLPTPLTAGSDFKIRIGYHGAPNDNAATEIFNTNPLYARTHGSNNRPVVFSVSQPYGTRRWWPCKDHPSDKATTSIQRIVVPKQAGYTLTAVSNGLLTNTIDHGTTLEYVWENSYPIATYLMSMAISDYIYRGGTYTSQDGQKTMPVGHWIHSEHLGLDGNGHVGTIQAMNFFAEVFGEYPFINEKYETAAWGLTYAIEHQTATSMPSGASDGVGNGLGRRNVHELAHHWFGDKVTMHSWNHLWLNEGFATYCEALFDEYFRGNFSFHTRVNGWIVGSGPVVSTNGDGFGDGNIYKRGAWVLHMLRFTIGDDNFFAAMRAYAATGYTTALSQPGNGDAPVDFQSVVEQASNMAPGTLNAFFTQWLYSSNNGPNHSSRPTYSYSASYDLETSSVQVRLNQTQSRSAFQMPVEIGLIAADSATTSVIVPAGDSMATFPMGNFVPVVSTLDPDNWVLNYQSTSIETVSLAPAILNEPYSFTLLQSSTSGSWQKISGASWITVSGTGVIQGTPPATGVYPVSVRLTRSGISIDAAYDLIVASNSPPPSVVINELLYENNDGDDTAEYVELLNVTGDPVDISGWQIAPISGSTGEATAATVTIPSGTILQPGDYYVAGNPSPINAVYGNVVDLNTNWNESLSDADPSAIVLKTNLGVRADSLAYRSDRSFASGSQTSLALAEGGTGRGISAGITNVTDNAVLGRLPNGADSGSNLLDFALIPPSPGAANSAGYTLPFFDDFNAGPRAEWKPAFETPVRVAIPGQAGKPPVAAPAPAGGAALEVYDTTGGGDVAYLPGAFEKLNMEGFIWIPQNVSPGGAWSTGVGIATRVESAWFSGSNGFALQNGFYLEYQNGPDVRLSGGRVPDTPGIARLLAVDASATPGVGFSGFSVTSLGGSTVVAPGSWQPFRLFFDGPANRLYANIGNSVIYDGVIPAGGYPLSGGVTIGFRENHSGNLSAANREGTWVDNIKLNTDAPARAGIEDFNLY